MGESVSEADFSANFNSKCSSVPALRKANCVYGSRSAVNLFQADLRAQPRACLAGSLSECRASLGEMAHELEDGAMELYGKRAGGGEGA